MAVQSSEKQFFYARADPPRMQFCYLYLGDDSSFPAGARGVLSRPLSRSCVSVGVLIAPAARGGVPGRAHKTVFFSDLSGENTRNIQY